MKESTLWFLHIVTALVLIIVIPIHLSNFTSFLSEGYFANLTWSHVAARGKQTFYAAVYMVFLGAALYHGMYGLRSMIFELTLSENQERAVSLACTIIGLIAFVYGAYAAIYAMFT